MLADQGEPSVGSGQLRSDLHLPDTAKLALIEFIIGELPKWRDRPERPEVTSESQLTQQLCRHMNEASRLSGWDHYQFGTEVPDEANKGRTIDLFASPSSGTISIGERRYTIFDTILPIECKRLPTPKSTDRDEREYLFSKFNTTGGVQRFKAGHHASTHDLCAMVGYLQSGDIGGWYETVNDWISGLALAGQTGWTGADQLKLENHHSTSRVAALRSDHSRVSGLTDMGIRHLWIEMCKSAT